ncbi:MAG: EAL domain-containing protein [Epsilonproteobacteria bacterium]|nr:EAL domain-containing protein [Campylobacterota bacterium]
MSNKSNIEELELVIKRLQRKQKLSEQALKQNNQITKKYSDILVKLKENDKFTSTVIESSINAIIAIDENQIVTIFNRSAERMFGYTKEEMIGRKSLKNIIPKHFWQQHIRAFSMFIGKKNSRNILKKTKALEGKRKDGTLFPIRIGFGIDIEKESVIVVANIEDITLETEVQNTLKNMNKTLEKKVELRTKELYNKAYYDELTGLANRAMFNKALTQAISKAKRNQTKMALFYIDLDRFKEINDSLGHSMGDAVLKEVSKRIKNKIRLEDVFARLGGDEFTIIMEDLKNTQGAVYLAQKIIEVLEEPICIDKNMLYISSSIGISLYPEDGDNAEKLLQDADSAMYKAKDEGRNNFQFYSSEMTVIAFNKVLMETNLRQALENEEFSVFYQPQTNAKYNQLLGMEALVRWHHPTMGLISPDKFIPIAEETGLIVALDRWTMKTAMKQMVKWYEEGLNPGRLALNLAIKQLQKDDFMEFLTKTIDEIGIKPQWIELEVTEGGIMDNPQKAIAILQNISDLGISIAIDDFGTGYSSLSYLKKLPIDKLKIDKSFIQDLPDDEDDVGITRAVIALSKSLNLRVIAEGVETSQQKDFLVENRCESIQGYFYAKPLSAYEMTNYLLMVKE